MTGDRDVANAIADGINCIAELASAIGNEEREGCDRPRVANPRWPEALREMERAFEAVIAKEVITSIVLGKEDVERVRRTRALVSAWLKDGHASEELRDLAEAILRSFGLPAVAQRNNARKDVP